MNLGSEQIFDQLICGRIVAHASASAGGLQEKQGKYCVEAVARKSALTPNWEIGASKTNPAK
jgi:hypothetical protein